jgi:hypothetical protein
MTISSNKSVRYRNRQKQKAVEYLGGRCVKCGYNKSLAALDFHHIDPLTKEWKPTRLMSYRWEIVKQELDKCELICANCHRELHEGVTDFSLLRNPKGQRKTYVKVCQTCECKFKTEKQKRKYCSVSCYRKSTRIVKKEPTKNDLKKLLDNNSSWKEMGDIYGISGNGIKKWAKKFGLI